MALNLSAFQNRDNPRVSPLQNKTSGGLNLNAFKTTTPVDSINKEKSKLPHIQQTADRLKQAVKIKEEYDKSFETEEDKKKFNESIKQAIDSANPTSQLAKVAKMMFIEAPARAAAAIGLTARKEESFTPGTGLFPEVEKFVFGDEKIADIPTQKKEVSKFLQEKLKFNPDQANNSAALVVAGLITFDLTPAGGSAKALVDPKKVKFLSQVLTKGDVKLIAEFTDLVEKGKDKKKLGELGKTMQSLTTNVFGKQAAGISNREMKILWDLHLKEVGRIENRAGLGLSIQDISKGKKPEEAAQAGLYDAETPKTVKVWNKSKFSDNGAYTDRPVIRKVENTTLYQGGKPGDKRQHWTSDKKYASQFGEVREKTGTFYQIDNGNRMTDVYVEAPRVPQQPAGLSEMKWYRGVDKRNAGQADKFYSANKSVAGDFGKVEQLKPSELPKNPLEVSSKDELAQLIGFKGDPTTTTAFDEVAKKYAQSKGHDGIVYFDGQLGEPELHRFHAAQQPIADVKPLVKTPKIPDRRTVLEKQQALKKEGAEELQKRQAEADLAIEERSLYTSSQISDINRLKKVASSKAAQAGDIETLRKTNPELVESVLSHVRQAKGDYIPDEEALKMALDLPTKDATRVKAPSAIASARALSSQVKAYMQGVRVGAIKTKEQIKDAQTALLNLIRESDLPLNDKGKLLATLKNVQNEKDLEKAFSIVEHLVNTVVKRTLKSEILGMQKKIINSPSIAVDYKAKVNELLSGFALKGKREDSLKQLQATQDFIQSEIAKGNDVEIPKRILKSLEYLNRTPFDKITTSQLEGIKAELELLEDLGKTKLDSLKNLWRIQQEKILIAIENQGTKPLNNIPLIKPAIGERLTITQKFRNHIRTTQNKMARLDRAISPMDTVFDLLDGAKGTYNGALFRFFKGRVDAGYGRYTHRKDVLQRPVINMIEKYKLDNRNFERMGVVAAREQDGGMKKLIASGFTEDQVNAVKLTQKEQELLDLMRSTFDSQFPEIQDVMRRVYNQPVEKVKNYFSFMTDWNAMDESEVFERFGSQLPEQFGAAKKNVEAGFTKSRVGGGQAIKINALDVFLKHTDNTSYLLEVGETSKMLGEVAGSDSFKNLVGDAGQLLVREWIDVVARKGGAAGASQIAILDTLRKNVGAAMLGLKLSTVAIQPTALFDGMGFIGSKYGIVGITKYLTSGKWRKFVGNMPEMRQRAGGEFAIKELTDGNWLQSAQRKGFIPMQIMDQITAGSIAAGAYARKMRELGKEVDLTNYNSEALAYAQLAIRRTQSSGEFKDVPLAISRGAMTGNRSLDRAMLQFQNFLLTRWSRIRHDAFRAGISKGDPLKAIPVFTSIILASLAGSGLRLGVNKIQDFITGTESKDSDQERLEKGFIFEMAGSVPFLGTALSMAMYDGEMFPILDAPKGVISGLNKAYNGKSESTKLRGLSEFAGSTSTLFGVPGTVQAEQLIRKSIKDEKKSDGLDINIPEVEIPEVELAEVDIPSIEL